MDMGPENRAEALECMRAKPDFIVRIPLGTSHEQSIRNYRGWKARAQDLLAGIAAALGLPPAEAKETP